MLAAMERLNDDDSSRAAAAAAAARHPPQAQEKRPSSGGPRAWLYRTGTVLLLLAYLDSRYLILDGAVVNFNAEDVAGRLHNHTKDLFLGSKIMSLKVPKEGVVRGGQGGQMMGQLPWQRQRKRSIGGIQSSLPSRRWLEGKRLGNNDDHLTKQDVQNLIAVGSLGPIGPLAASLACDASSPVATSSSHLNGNLNYDVTSPDEWTRWDASAIMVRAFHENQYGPARVEARRRLEEWDVWEDTLFRGGAATAGVVDAVLANNGGGGANATAANGTEASIGPIERVGLFDFECPTAKFIVVKSWPGSIGLGATLRGMGVTSTMFAGIGNDRVIIFATPVPMASCERGDLQCSFLPLSPCVLTEEEVEGAPVLEPGAVPGFLRDHPDERVVAVESQFRSGDFRGGIRRAMMRLYSMHHPDRTEEERSAFADKIGQATGRNYGFVRSKWNAEVAAQFYLLRPNGAMRETIRRIMEESFPSGYDSSRAIGMPIRGSDKCRAESECPEFSDYMDKAKAYMHVSKPNGTYIVVTSEDRKVLQAQLDYEKEDESNLTYIVNKREVAQGRGSYSANASRSQNITMEDIMTMTVATLRMQMHVGHLFTNACSHFHKLIAGWHNFGCSVAEKLLEYGLACGPQMGAAGKWIKDGKVVQ